ncbi:MAG: alpha/beta hydrolase [Sphingomonadales bacterium]|nr:MAG: alpha/beta hydrolase [Sphingomonadales bacterium]
MAYLDTDDGGRVYYEHHRAPKLPVVLIHGWGMSGDYWASAVEALLADGHGAITVDHRGCGRSDRDFTDMSIDAIARDVAAIVERCELPRVALNGWSLGGAVAVLAEGASGEGASEAMIGWVERGFLATGPRASTTLAGLATLDQRDLLASFDFPVLSIGGARDSIADPAIAGFAANCAKDGTLLTLDTGHSPQLEAPSVYNEALLDFVRKLA